MSVQWLRLIASNAGGAGLIPGWETKILPAARQPKVKKKKKKKERKKRKEKMKGGEKMSLHAQPTNSWKVLGQCREWSEERKASHLPNPPSP